MDITVDREGIAKTKIKVLVRFETRARIIYPDHLTSETYCQNLGLLWGYSIPIEISKGLWRWGRAKKYLLNPYIISYLARAPTPRSPRRESPARVRVPARVRRPVPGARRLGHNYNYTPAEKKLLRFCSGKL